jgi:uncharacterized protein
MYAPKVLFLQVSLLGLNCRMKIKIALVLLLVAVSFPFGAALAAEEKVAPPDMVTYYFVLLTRGPKWTPEQTAETQKIQDGHLANIGKLHDAGKLALAGPFTDKGSWRGIFILKAASVEEAKSLVDTDPAVQAGRLAFEIHPWMTKKGMLQ